MINTVRAGALVAAVQTLGRNSLAIGIPYYRILDGVVLRFLSVGDPWGDAQAGDLGISPDELLLEPGEVAEFGGANGG